MKTSSKIVIGGTAAALTAALTFAGTVVAAAHDGGKSVRGSGLSSLVTDGTITADQADAIADALREGHAEHRESQRAEMQAARDAALAALVADGTLTQSQVDAITAANRTQMRDLISSGAVDREDLRAVRDALRTAHDAERADRQTERASALASVLDGLVADGTITRSQADAVTTAIEAHQAGRDVSRLGQRGGKHGGAHGGLR